MQDVNMGEMLGKGFRGFSASFFATICESLFFSQKKRFLKCIHAHIYKYDDFKFMKWLTTAKDETPVKRPDEVECIGLK